MKDRRPAPDDFDFWVGSWDCIWEGGHGTNRITRELGGRVLVERFEVAAPEPFSGMSLTVYDSVADRWRQTWADSEGNFLTLAGGPQEDTVILTTVTPEGEPRPLKRMVFFDIAEDRLTWRWEGSVDDGCTWRPLWLIHYRRSRHGRRAGVGV